MEVSVLPQDGYPAALQHLRLPHLAGTGVVTRRFIIISTQYKDNVRPENEV